MEKGKNKKNKNKNKKEKNREKMGKRVGTKGQNSMSFMDGSLFGIGR